jgi:hypothetical protein
MQELIRKIIIGKNPKDAMAYYIGMKAGDKKVSAIVLDESILHRFNIKRYLIYLQSEDGSQVLWKSVDDMPCIIEFDCNF